MRLSLSKSSLANNAKSEFENAWRARIYKVEQLLAMIRAQSDSTNSSFEDMISI